MVKKRVHELAKELNIESKEIIKKLSQMGIEVKSHMSTIEDKDVGEILRQYRKAGQADEKKVSERTSKVSETRGAPNAAAPTARESKGDLRRDKEKNALDAKKTDKNRGTQSGSRHRTDYNRGPGLVDRVPSRPPDRRFQEKPPEKQARPWGAPKVEQQTKPKMVESPPERPKFDKPQQDRPLQEKRQLERPLAEQPAMPKPTQGRTGQTRPQGEHARPDRPFHERGQGQTKPQPQGRTPGTAPQQGPTPRYPRQGGPGRPQDQRSAGGFRPGGGPAVTGARVGERGAAPMGPSDRRVFDRGPGTAAKPRTDQQAIRPMARPDDKGRPALLQTKTPDKQKPVSKPGAQKTAKGRYEKRSAIAEHAEGKLRHRTGPRKKGPAKSHEIKPLQPVEKKPVILGESTTVQELSLKMHKGPAELIKKLLSMGVMVTINQEIDTDTALILAEEYGYEVEIKLPVDLEAQLMQEPEEDSALLQTRPCVVTVMGHVDHGKTSLLDAIRETNVTATEAGGITQHIGAYQVEHNGKKITFVDTPGHEAFTAMRARGAQVTDIAILVVAADDGVMPQTIEAINHSKDAKVPIIVAINKIDKPGANPDRVKQELTEHGLVAEEWGGDTICVNVSAIKREGLTDLLEMILLVAEVSELKANQNRPARGTVIEAELDKARGPVANVLVQNGSLNIGDTIIAGAALGRVRAMMDDKGRRIKKAGPSTPVEVIGFSDVPLAGDIFMAVEDEKLARTIVARRQTKKREEELKTTTRVSLEDLFKHIQEGQIKELGIIVKADVQGSVEALRQALERLNTGEVKVNIIHGGVGAISETDIMFASASNAIIIGFNVRPDVNARKAAESEKVDVRLYRVIYDAIEDVKAAMSGLLDPEYKEVMLGRAEIRKIFRASKIGTIAGCYVLEGKLERDAGVRVVRDGIVVHEGKLDSLKRFKDDVKEVVQGYECGLALEKFNEIKEGDIIEAFSIEAIKRELS
ncbi:Translation initiation factor IF-2 [Pelotomaculum schinkii]|uniref:Translation initiation factor IF-2 n=1 Tax=Pelotomaculum schinkii TaxID=78350 RepID=A0A4Y7RD45_9FIRM|nr:MULTISPECIES: translation initiation factor IF-2 [Pelotomaculum]TEB06746.1 Translation initiation factor IF-2 [Pelotomaculum schinkii]TEB16580.1 Translation initiation factor IF-2 [Pelotomaculum sp. FP]